MCTFGGRGGDAAPLGRGSRPQARSRRLSGRARSHQPGPPPPPAALEVSELLQRVSRSFRRDSFLRACRGNPGSDRCMRRGAGKTSPSACAQRASMGRSLGQKRRSACRGCGGRSHRSPTLRVHHPPPAAASSPAGSAPCTRLNRARRGPLVTQSAPSSRVPSCRGAGGRAHRGSRWAGRRARY